VSQGRGPARLRAQPQPPEVPRGARGRRTEWKRIGWDDALDRIARLLKADRDANFQTTNADGKTVNRWTSSGMLCASASSNETGYITHKAFRSTGMLVFDNQARV
jgi:formate dehydrogenase major subunit